MIIDEFYCFGPKDVTEYDFQTISNYGGMRVSLNQVRKEMPRVIHHPAVHVNTHNATHLVSILLTNLGEDYEY